MSKWFLIAFLAVALPVQAQDVLSQPAPDLYGGGIPATMVRQADGKVIVGGMFTQASGQPVRYLARYHPDGSIDDTYAPVLDGWVEDMQLDSQGRLYVMLRGYSSASDADLQFVRRIDETGQVDESFAPPAPANAYDNGWAILLDEASGALYASYSVQASPLNRVVVRRYHLADGSLDAGFQVDAERTISDMVRHDEHIVLTGWFWDINGVPRKGLARVDRLTGAVDESWDPGATVTGSFTGRTLLLDGTHVLVGSNGQNLGGGTNRGVARISLADGSADSAWSTPIAGSVYALARDSQARILAFGPMTQINGAAWSRSLARFSAAGQHEAGWGDPDARIGNSMKEVLVLPGDDVLTAQAGSTSDSMPRLLRHAAVTGISTDFAADFLDVPRVGRVFALEDDLLVVGAIFSMDGVVGVGAARLDANGAVIPGWRSELGSVVDWVSSSVDAAVSSEHVYLTGWNSAAGGLPSVAPVRRLSLSSGTLDLDWHPQTSLPSGSVSGRVALDETGGFVYVFGSNLSSDPANRSLARFDIDDATLDMTWKPGFLGSVQQMALVSGYLYIAGNFTTVGGVDVPRLARIPVSGDGTPDAAWRPAPAAASAIAFDVAGGWVYVGGSSGNNIVLNRYRLSDGVRDEAWEPLAGRAGSISRLVLDGLVGNLYVIGDLSLGCNGGRLSAIRLYSGPNQLDPLWRVEFDGYGAALNVLPRDDGSTLVVGSFERINGAPRQSVAALGMSNSIFADGMGLGDNTSGCVQ